jgi:hypothetical protein
MLSLLLLAVIALSGVVSFQLDELPEDAEEWGLVREAPLVIKSKVGEKVEADYGDDVPLGGKLERKGARGAAGAKKITFLLEYFLGDGKFEQIGMFTGILRTSVQESGQERQVRYFLVRLIVSCHDL